MKLRTNLYIATLVSAALASNIAVGEEADPRKKIGPFASFSTGASAIVFDDIDSKDIGDTDHSGFVAKIEAGYWFSDHWGVSANYVNLGKFEQEYADGVFRGKAESYGLSLLGRLPFGEKWALVGKANLLRTKMDNDGSTVGSDLRDQLIGEENSLVLPGLEINYSLNDQAVLFFEMDTRGPVTDEVMLGFAGIGLRWAF